ncbi:Peroxiredoxin [Chthonomonas calidirosea]|nr:Peroxiredoxin [Chthonomonas calidirosea]
MSRIVNSILLSSALLGLTLHGAALPSQPPTSRNAVASQKAKAAAILQKVHEAYAQLKTFQARFTNCMTMQVHQQTIPIGMVMNGEVAFNSPKHCAYRIQVAGSNGFPLPATTVISDGKQVWMVVGNRYLQKPVSEAEGVMGLSMGFTNNSLSEPNQIKSPLDIFAPNLAAGQIPKDIRLVAYKPLDGKPAYVLQFTEPLPTPASAGMNLTVQVWVDAATHFIRRLVERGRFQGISMKMVEDIQPLPVDKPLPDSLFTYQPPKDAQKVETDAELWNLPNPGSTPNAATNDSSQKRAAKLIGKPAPDFTLKTIDGKTVSLHDLRGKIVLLDFSTSW